MATTLSLNILLGVVCLGFVLFIWAGGLPSGPEGPVGAWIVPVPFLFALLAVMIACILRGRFDRIAGGRPLAFVLLAGFLVAVTVALFAAFERRDSAIDYVYRAIPFIALLGCFWAAGGWEIVAPGRAAKVLGPSILAVTSLCGWGLMGRAMVARIQEDVAAAERESVRDRANAEARDARSVVEFQSLPADVSLRRVIQFEFAGNPEVQRQARQRIESWPARDEELARILTDEHLSVLDCSWTISYIASLHPSPPAQLAPAYGQLLDRAYRYWESTLRYDPYASKSEPELSMLMKGAERIQRAGGDLRPQLQKWQELLSQAKGLRGLAGYTQDLARGR